jgi:hypothetical protein
MPLKAKLMLYFFIPTTSNNNMADQMCELVRWVQYNRHLIQAPDVMYGNKSECLMTGNPLTRIREGTKVC